MGTEIAEKKFSYWLGLINLIVTFVVVWILWYIFMNQDAVMKLYTPFYGFALILVFLYGIVLMRNVIDYPAFIDKVLPPNRVWRGIVLSIVAVLFMYVMVYIVLWNFIGRLGVAYFSPSEIIASGGIGAEPWSARENASIAIIYLFTAFLWVSLVWAIGFGRWPWQTNKPSVIAWSKVFAITFFSIIIYSIMFHPHVGYLFYPAQSKAAAMSWWAGMAGTGSAFFSLAIALSALYWLIASDMHWDGYPWKLFKKEGEGTCVAGVLAFVFTVIFGIIMMYILAKIMNASWGEAFTGGQYTDGPDFRFLHMAQIAGFFILGSYILKHFFNNFPNTESLWLRSIIRNIIALIIGVLIYWFYYSPLAVFFLNRVPGVAQPDDNSLVWTLLFLSVVMIQFEFLEGWPLTRKSKELA